MLDVGFITMHHKGPFGFTPQVHSKIRANPILPKKPRKKPAEKKDFKTRKSRWVLPFFMLSCQCEVCDWLSALPLQL